MAVIKIPQSVFDAGKPLPPGWYKAQVIKIEQQPASKGDSTNTIVTFKTEKGDRELPKYLNSKFPLDAPKMELALNGNNLDSEHNEIDTDDWLHKKCQILLGEMTWKGNLINSIDDFASYDKDLNPPDWVG